MVHVNTACIAICGMPINFNIDIQRSPFFGQYRIYVPHLTLKLVGKMHLMFKTVIKYVNLKFNYVIDVSLGEKIPEGQC